MNTDIFSTLPLDVENIGIHSLNLLTVIFRMCFSLLLDTISLLQRKARFFACVIGLRLVILYFYIVLRMNTIFSTLPLDVENIGIHTQNVKDASSQTMRSLASCLRFAQTRR